MLLILVVFSVGLLRSFFTPEKTRDILAGKKESAGNILAAGLGIAIVSGWVIGRLGSGWSLGDFIGWF